MSFIASPEIVIALALAGRLSFDPRRDTLAAADGTRFMLEPPAPAPDVPADGFEGGDAAYVAPQPIELRSKEPVPIDPASERLARMTPWPAWDGRDVEHAEVLIKTQGTTTTDQISPAGPWLRLRGHLERFSDNFLSGGVDAFGPRAESPAARARALRSKGAPWVVVGDWNYGEGSSREHAALSPRLLGGVAVIARSFARIHETNLKKQGLLALVFADPADYDRVRAGDRVSLIDLAHLAPGADVTCELAHADGTRETIRLRHSYSAAQLDWFRTGSALNAASQTGGPGTSRA
jgi:aconitate hydratase